MGENKTDAYSQDKEDGHGRYNGKNKGEEGLGGQHSGSCSHNDHPQGFAPESKAPLGKMKPP